MFCWFFLIRQHLNFGNWSKTQTNFIMLYQINIYAPIFRFGWKVIVGDSASTCYDCIRKMMQLSPNKLYFLAYLWIKPIDTRSDVIAVITIIIEWDSDMFFVIKSAHVVTKTTNLIQRIYVKWHTHKDILYMYQYENHYWNCLCYQRKHN